MKNPYPLQLDDHLYICGYSPSTNQAGECGRLLSTRPKGPLIFTQSTLSCKLQQCSKMEAHVHSNPNALSSHTALADKAQLHMGFTIIQIKQLG